MKNNTFRTALLILAFSPILLFAPRPSAEASSSRLSLHPPAPYINEVLLNPQEGDFQWVELHSPAYYVVYLPLMLRSNPGSASLGTFSFTPIAPPSIQGPVDISGWQITNEDGSSYTVPNALPPVPPDSYVLIHFDGQGATADDYDFSDAVAVLHTSAGLVDIFDPESGQVGLYNSSNHTVQTICHFVAWGEPPRKDSNAVRADLWRDSWWVNLHIGSGLLTMGVELPPNLSIGLRPGSHNSTPADWSVYLEDDITPGKANLLPSAYWSTVADGAEIASDGFALGWSWVPDAAYQFQMHDSLDFSAPLVDIVLEAPWYAPEDPVPPGGYWWRVRPMGSDGRLAAWSPPSRVSVSSIEGGVQGIVEGQRTVQQVELSIDLLRQRKDTALLCLDGCQEGNPNDPTMQVAWDSPHPTDTIYEHGSANCVRASIAMIVTNYGGSLSQDRIAYEENNGAGPWLDLGHNTGVQGCGPTGSVTRQLLAWALGIDASDVIYAQGKPAYQDISDWIDARQPILRLHRGHATVIAGYRTRYLGLAQEVLLLDPWTGQQSWRSFGSSFDFQCYYVPPAAAPDVRSDEPGITVDSDADGIMDFDEEIRWSEPHNNLDPSNPDTDGDGVHDKQDMREYLFDNSGDPISRNPDIDNDGLFKEVDPDNDGGGSLDGCEDTNRNGRYEPHLGETSNFDPSQEKICHESTITDIVFDPPSPATLHYVDTVYATFHYSTTYAGYFKMWVAAYADGYSVPHMESPWHYGPASGTDTLGFSVWSGDGTITIDTARFIMLADDRSTYLVDFTVPVEYNYIP